VNARAAGIVEAVVGVVLGVVFIGSGAAAWLWERVEADVPWRNGPTATGVLAYLAICWGGCTVFQLAAASVWGRSTDHPASSAYLAMNVANALCAVITSCVILATQVLAGVDRWLAVVLAILLVATLLNAYVVRESLRRAIIAWAWRGAGIALATLLIDAYFVELPLFVVRLAVVMTVWDWLGERLGVTPRLLRLAPSFYAGSSSSRVAAQARATR